MNAAIIAQRLGAKGPDRKGWWNARCPFPGHDDANPSFGFTTDGYKCHGCGRQGAIGELAEHLGLEDSPRRSDRLTADDAARLLYNRGLRDETVARFKIAADVGAQAWRFPMPNGSARLKAFPGRWGAKTWWEGTSEGAELNGLPGALKLASDALYLVEGEPDTWIAQQAGLPAVTFTAGASTVPEAGVRQLVETGKRIRVIYDRDKPGNDGARKAAAALRLSGADVDVLELPDSLPPGGDLTDLYGSLDRDDAAFRRTVEGLTPRGGLPRAVPASAVSDAEPPTFVVDDLILEADLHLIASEGGAGKTSWIVALLGAVAAGCAAFDRFPTRIPGPVLFVSGEDGDGVLRNRLEALCTGHGWDADKVLARVHLLCQAGAALEDAEWQAHLIAEARRIGARVVALDPLYDLTTVPENSNDELKPVVRFLRRLAAETGRDSGNVNRGPARIKTRRNMQLYAHDEGAA